MVRLIARNVHRKRFTVDFTDETRATSLQINGFAVPNRYKIGVCSRLQRGLKRTSNAALPSIPKFFAKSHNNSVVPSLRW